MMATPISGMRIPLRRKSLPSTFSAAGSILTGAADRGAASAGAAASAAAAAMATADFKAMINSLPLDAW